MGFKIPFPPSERTLAALEARIAEDLTPQEVRDLEEQIAKTGQYAHSLFDQLEQKKNQIVQRQVSDVKKVLNFSEQIEELSLIWNSLTPEEIAEKLIELKEKAIHLNQTECPRIQKIFQESVSELEHLHFSFVFPISREFVSSVDPTFLTRMQKTIKDIGSQNSSAPFLELCERQQKEVSYYLRGDHE